MENLRSGMRVVHPVFGAGVVRAVSGSGETARVTVDFARKIGIKKLVAGPAKLRSMENETEEQEEARLIWGAAKMPAQDQTPDTAWYECLVAGCQPKPRRYPPKEKLYEVIREGVTRHEFWTAIRDRMRNAGKAPKVLDHPSGNVSVSISGLLNTRVVVRHDELIQECDAILARAIFETIASLYLGDFDTFTFKSAFGIELALDEKELVVLRDEDLENLHRAPRRKPLPVRAPGTITNMPRRRDDY